MYNLILHKLKCYDPQDWRSDECRLEVYVDEALQPYLKHSMTEGASWLVGRDYPFKDQVEIKLWEEDALGGDDLLGTVKIQPQPINNGTVEFTQKGAHYKLWCQVVDAPDVDLVESALQEFERSPHPGVWAYIPKPELLADIRRTIANPFLINQHINPFCGPASILFDLVSQQPSRYVSICQTLYETGKFQGRTKEVKPSKTFRNSRVRPKISVADWMLMGTLRDSENLLFRVNADASQLSSNLAGITFPWELTGWASEILGYDHIQHHSTAIYGEFEAMRAAEQARRKGGAAFLLIDAALLKTSTSLVTHPNHWIVYLGNLEIEDGVWNRHDSGHIRFDCYSWGRKYPVDVGEDEFEDHLWSVVTAY